MLLHTVADAVPAPCNDLAALWSVPRDRPRSRSSASYVRSLMLAPVRTMMKSASFQRWKDLRRMCRQRAASMVSRIGGADRTLVLT